MRQNNLQEAFSKDRRGQSKACFFFQHSFKNVGDDAESSLNTLYPPTWFPFTNSFVTLPSSHLQVKRKSRIPNLCMTFLKFGFSEKATKFEKNLRRTFDKSIVFCACNSILVKKSMKIFENKHGHVILYKL